MEYNRLVRETQAGRSWHFSHFVVQYRVRLPVKFSTAAEAQ